MLPAFLPALRVAGIAYLLAHLNRQRVAGQERTSLPAAQWRALPDAQGGPPRWNITRTARECGYACFEFVERVEGGAEGFTEGRPGSPPRHTHLAERETFAVLEGTMAVVVDGAVAEYAAGETAVVPAGASHQWWAVGGGPLAMRITLEPPGPMGEAFFENLAGLRRDGRGNPLALLQLFREGGMSFDEAPAALQPLTGGLAPKLAWWLGWEAYDGAYTWPCYDPLYRTSEEHRARFRGRDCGMPKCDPACGSAWKPGGGE